MTVELAVNVGRARRRATVHTITVLPWIVVGWHPGSEEGIAKVIVRLPWTRLTSAIAQRNEYSPFRGPSAQGAMSAVVVMESVWGSGVAVGTGVRVGLGVALGMGVRGAAAGR